MEACACLKHLMAQPTWLLALTTVGLLSLIRLSVATLLWIYATFLRPGKDLKRRYGTWAVVTGSTDGIGKAFAFQLARKGLKLVLVGRNPDKLKETSAAVKEKYGKTQVETVVVDFAGDLDGGVQRLREKVERLDVGVLVNNAGVSYPYARFFHEVDEELMRNLIKVNVEGVTKVTQAVLPGMLKRKRGAIVNIGSGAAIVIPSDPLYAVYAATKAYIDQFSRCLYVEYKNSGIDVQCQWYQSRRSAAADVCRPPRSASRSLPSPYTAAASCDLSRCAAAAPPRRRRAPQQQGRATAAQRRHRHCPRPQPPPAPPPSPQPPHATAESCPRRAPAPPRRRSARRQPPPSAGRHRRKPPTPSAACCCRPKQPAARTPPPLSHIFPLSVKGNRLLEAFNYFLMGTEETKDLLKNVDWKTLGNTVTDQASGPVFKKRLPKKLRQVPDYYFLPRRSITSALALSAVVCAAGVGAGMLVEIWINKKIQEDGGVIWEMDEK